MIVLPKKQPFGIKPTTQQLEKALSECCTIQDSCPETTCQHHEECCHAGSPNMYFIEYENIHKNIIKKMSVKEYADMTLACIRTYLFSGKRCPCLFLKDKMCSIYKYRQIKCRLYGLIPPDLFDRNANAVATEEKLPRNLIPLSQQCPFVKIKPEWQDRFPNGCIPEDMIVRMETEMKAIDRSLGISQKQQDEGTAFLTFHDWHLLSTVGEDFMATLTPLRLQLDDKSKEHMVSAFAPHIESIVKKLQEE